MYINYNKVLFTLYLILCPLFFSFLLEKRCEKIKLTVNKIDSTTLVDSYLIYCKVKNKQVVLCSKKEFTQLKNCNPLVIGMSYKIQLKKKFALELDGIRFRLYSNDIYVDNKLIVKKETSVFESADIKGLCLNVK